MNAILAELRSHWEAFKMLKSQSASLKSQIREVHTSLEKLLESKVADLERLIAENREELKAEMDNKVRQIQANLNLNFRTLLTELPCGKVYFLIGSSRLVNRDQAEPAGSASRYAKSRGERGESMKD